MTDLYNINTPFGELPDDVAVELFLAVRRGAEWAWCPKSGPAFTGTDRAPGFPTWYPDVIYRLVKPSPIRDVYPWKALHKDIVFCARDASGAAYGFAQIPTAHSRYWSLNVGGDAYRIDRLCADYIPGTVNWRDSGERRPEGGK